MDELITLIIQGILSLFGGDGSAKPKPPAQKWQPAVRQGQQQANPVQRSGPVQRADPAQRISTTPRFKPARRLTRSNPAPKQKMARSPQPPQLPRATPPLPPPLPQPVAAQSATGAGAATARNMNSTPLKSSPSISAAAISKLIQSRPSAVRNMWVLSEVLQPPIAMRDRDSIRG